MLAPGDTLSNKQSRSLLIGIVIKSKLVSESESQSSWFVWLLFSLIIRPTVSNWLKSSFDCNLGKVAIGKVNLWYCLVDSKSVG